MSRSLLIALHGKQAANVRVRQAVAAQRKAGHKVEVRVTWEAGDVRRIVREAIDSRADTVVAGGGDGTINEVVDALIAHQSAGSVRNLDNEPTARVGPALGILPLGTANDFARAAGIPLDPVAAL